jgi:hypothetical protein
MHGAFALAQKITPMSNSQNQRIHSNLIIWVQQKYIQI